MLAFRGNNIFSRQNAATWVLCLIMALVLIVMLVLYLLLHFKKTKRERKIDKLDEERVRLTKDLPKTNYVNI